LFPQKSKAMKTEQQKQAEELFFQTDLTKTEIAEAVGVSRRTIHYWVRENHWNEIRLASGAMPTYLAGNCYLILARLQESILARTDSPITLQEVNAIYKLSGTIAKLQKRAALSENLETLTHFMDFAHDHDPQLAHDVQPLVSTYIDHSAGNAAPAMSTPPIRRQNPDEAQLDNEDLAAWEEVLKSIDDIHRTQSYQPQPASPGKKTVAEPASKPASTQHLNRAARRALARKAA
jgi:DNA-binding XRE family transcriptional regulator